jgi:hypothetical protein
MAYEFSFDGKSLWALGGGSLVLSLLLFFAGLLLGANWGTRDAAASVTTAAPDASHAPARSAAGTRDAAAANAGTSVAALPYIPPSQEPAVYDAPAPRDYAAQSYGPPVADAQGYAAQGYGAQGYPTRPPADYGAQQRYAAPPAVAGASATGTGMSAAGTSAARDASSAPPVNLAREAARLSSAGIDPDPRLVSEADDSGAQAVAQTPAGYSVQAGAYADETEARRLLGDLENKGYTPTLFRGLDAEGRPWFAVRVGAYASQREASRAAENFSRQERLKAAVRPSNSL